MSHDSGLSPFREHASGLYVPTELSRAREVWTSAEWRAIDRATKILTDKGVKLYLRCEQPSCKAAPMERLRNPDGGITLRCQHKDRIVSKAI